MNWHESTPAVTLHDMAQPLRESGALPADISLSVGVIAYNDPKEIREATFKVMSEYVDQTSRASSDIAERYGEIYAARLSHAEDQKQWGVDHHTEWGSKTQDLLGMSGSLGGIPDPETLKKVFEHQEALEEYQQQVPFNDPKVTEARDTYATMAAEKLNAQLSVGELKEDLELAKEIALQRQKLAKRGRMGAFAASFAIGAMAAIGLVGSIEEAPKSSVPESQQTFEQRDQAIMKSAENKSKKLLAGVAIISSMVGGVLIGTARSDKFAQQRAQQLIKKAYNNPVSVA